MCHHQFGLDPMLCDTCREDGTSSKVRAQRLADSVNWPRPVPTDPRDIRIEALESQLQEANLQLEEYFGVHDKLTQARNDLIAVKGKLEALKKKYRNHLDCTECKTANEIDHKVCYPIPVPDSQPIVVSWGVLRQLTDFPVMVKGLRSKITLLEKHQDHCRRALRLESNENAVERIEWLWQHTSVTPTPAPTQAYHGVYVRNSAKPNTPVAMFLLQNHANEWAREEYGRWDGLKFIFPDTVEIMPTEIVNT